MYFSMLWMKELGSKQMWRGRVRAARTALATPCPQPAIRVPSRRFRTPSSDTIWKRSHPFQSTSTNLSEQPDARSHHVAKSEVARCRHASARPQWRNCRFACRAECHILDHFVTIMAGLEGLAAELPCLPNQHLTFPRTWCAPLQETPPLLKGSSPSSTSACARSQPRCSTEIAPGAGFRQAPSCNAP